MSDLRPIKDEMLLVAVEAERRQERYRISEFIADLGMPWDTPITDYDRGYDDALRQVLEHLGSTRKLGQVE